MIKKDATLADDFDRLKMHLFNTMPELANTTICANCGASMKEYIYSIDAWDGMLLLSMAKAVRERMSSGLSFTDANQVHVPTLAASHAVRCRTTKASKLGLVAELRNNGKRVSGTWVITKRGWQALRGESVPAKVKVWRKHIEERFDDMTTLSSVFSIYRRNSDIKARKGRPTTSDMVSDSNVREYNASDWFDFTIHKGNIM